MSKKSQKSELNELSTKIEDLSVSDTKDVSFTAKKGVKVTISLEGTKEEPPVEQSEVQRLRESLQKYQAMNEQVKLYTKNLERKELRFIKGNLAGKKVDKTPGIDDTYREELQEFNIITAQDLYDKYQEGTIEGFKDWATDVAEGVGMQTQYYRAVIRGFALREMKRLMDN